jgi:hypothetical protein
MAAMRRVLPGRIELAVLKKLVQPRYTDRGGGVVGWCSAVRLAALAVPSRYAS